jgi:hypothetical protein
VGLSAADQRVILEKVAEARREMHRLNNVLLRLEGDVRKNDVTNAIRAMDPMDGWLRSLQESYMTIADRLSSHRSTPDNPAGGILLNPDWLPRWRWRSR